jgi:hypothetical protein
MSMFRSCSSVIKRYRMKASHTQTRILCNIIYANAYLVKHPSTLDALFDGREAFLP